jgi:hypothetical protein
MKLSFHPAFFSLPHASAWPGLAGALGFLREGDVLVIWKLDQPEHSLSHQIAAVAYLGARCVGQNRQAR